ncbi:alpha/beta hydrolase [Kushneria aurantia]|uniref:Alpha/beta hydrolase n=1 Tax=Kushneria aurantia TaxID=504092 RepID=A0ABV6G7X8_9GAMM|nr:alpha/beta hydrolase [Kushneria aurantia]
MTLDPQFAHWLEEAAANAPDVSGLSVQERRRIADRGNLALQTDPAEYSVADVEERRFKCDGHEIGVRIYHPTVHGTRSTRPVTVFYHGGGFVTGSVETYDVICRALCRASKSILVSVDYRLAPEHPFPAAAEDALAALRFVGDNAGSFGGDATRIALAGDSAGGQLAALTALRARDEGGPAVMGQCLLYPQLDASPQGLASLERFAEGHGYTRAMRDWYLSQYLVDDEARDHPFNTLLSRHDLAGVAPALVLTAEYDPVGDEGVRYAERLAAQGVTVRHSRYFGMIHAFVRRLGQHRQADQAIEECGAWLRTALSPGSGSAG